MIKQEYEKLVKDKLESFQKLISEQIQLNFHQYVVLDFLWSFISPFLFLVFVVLSLIKQDTFFQFEIYY